MRKGARIRRQIARYTILVEDDCTSAETWTQLRSHSRADRSRKPGIDPDQMRIETSTRFAAKNLRGARTVVLGPADSHTLVSAAGGAIVSPAPGQSFDVLVIGDESGFPFLEALDDVLSMLYRAIDRGESPMLLLPNPDLVYPKRAGEFGFAAGTIARMLEEAIALRFQMVGLIDLAHEQREQDRVKKST